MRAQLHALYFGDSPKAVRFRLGVLAIDVVAIAFFIAAPLIRDTQIFYGLDYAIAAILAAELLARWLASTDKRFFTRPIVLVDVLVLVTLLAPQLVFNLGFLRILKLWSLLHSEFFWCTVARRYDDTRWEEVTKTAATLVTFIFVITGLVYTSYARVHPGIDGYIDALYFTVATLTTTGFGDITLPGLWGRLISIVTMIVGITLFLRLAQTLFRPYKVKFLCQTCGLSRHEPDAVHCKACGVLLNIFDPDD